MPGATVLDKPMSVSGLREQVAQKIEAAFANTPYPGDDQICKSGDAGEDLANALRGLHWHEVEIVTIANCHMDMPLMTAEAFRYYLPAFMLALMNFYQHAGTLPMSLLHTLTPPDSGLLQKYIENPLDTTKNARVGDFLNRVTVFNAEEKAAIRLFLETYDKWCPKLRGEQRYLQRALEFWQNA